MKVGEVSAMAYHHDGIVDRDLATYDTRGQMAPERIEVIRTVHTVGRGTPDDICRNVISYWLPREDGTYELLVAFDPGVRR